MLLFSLDFNEFCFEEKDSDYTWEKSPVGALLIKDCPDGKTGWSKVYHKLLFHLYQLKYSPQISVLLTIDDDFICRSCDSILWQ